MCRSASQFRAALPGDLRVFCLTVMLLGGAPCLAQAPQPDAPSQDPKPAALAAGGIPIGKETTRISGPLKKNGAIDYLEAINQLASKGVTPANNAAVAFWQAMGAHSPLLAEIDTAEFFGRLGVDAPAGQGAYWLSSEQFAKENAKRGVDIQEAIAAARNGPWAAADRPHVARWIEANRQPLEAIVAGLDRPRFYTPSLLGKGAKEGVLIEVELVCVQATRDVARLLAARAMLRLGNRDLDGAWKDLHACHRLARHAGAGATTLIEGLVALSIEGVAAEGDRSLAAAGIDAATARRIQNDLAKLPPLPPMSRLVDTGERFMFLDAAQNLAAGQSKVDSFKELQGAISAHLVASTIDWSEPMKLGNQYYDRLVASMDLPTHRERVEASDVLMNELKSIARPNALQVAAALLAGDGGKMVGRQIGNILVALLLPAVEQARLAEERVAMESELASVAFALAEYRAVHDAYPRTLPGLKKPLPKDRFTGQPLVYRLDGNGYWLYSVGANGKDDRGTGPSTGATDAAQDDIAFHIE